MNSEELIHRIVRVLEDGDAWEDGAGLAAEYAERVRALGRRMEAVEGAQAKGEYGEAMRLMEERPRLLDEIGMLDFHQWGPWKGKCAEKGWETPPAVDSPAVERLLEAYNNSAAMDSLLKEYRKAVRTHDAAGQVLALRPLAKGPGGGDWTDALQGAEEAWAQELGRQFEAAAEAGDEAAAAAAADELLGDGWTVVPSAALRNRVKAWKDMKASAERQAALGVCVERLKSLAGGAWDLARAGSTVREARFWMAQGAIAGVEDAALIDLAETRVREETAAADAAERRRKNEAALREALRTGDAGKAEEVLDSPEVREGGVDGDLLRDAEEMVEAAATAHRRRMRLLAAGLLLLLAAAAGATGYTYMAKQREARCAAACERFEKAMADARPWAVLEAQLKALERDDPKVYAMEAVRKYDEALKDIQAKRAERLGAVARQLSELDGLSAEGWKTAEEGDIERRMASVRGLLDGDMGEEQGRLAALELAWNAEKDARRDARLAEARGAMPALREEKERLSERLGRTYLIDSLAQAVDAWQANAAEWEGKYGELASAESAEIEGWSRELETARKTAADAVAAVQRLMGAHDAVAVVEARAALREHYRAYPGVEAMGDLPVTAEQVAAALRCELPEQKNVSRLRRAISNDEGWKKFLEEKVWPAVTIPELAGLYGIDKGPSFEAISIGKCRLSPPGSSMSAKGELLWLSSEEMVKELDFAPRVYSLKQYQVLLPPCEELQDVVGASRAPRMGPGRFTTLLYEKIAGHIHAARGPAVPPFGDWTYQKAESGEPRPRPLQKDRYPAYKRVQMMAWYFDWLEEMGALSGIGEARRQLVEQCRRLAEDIPIGAIDPALSWTCLENPRVAKRNKECAAFLLRMPEDFSKECLEMQSERQKLQAISGWQLAYAGKVPFHPGKTEAPKPAQGIRPDHPLYVMRAAGGHVECKAILRPESGEWKETDVKGIPGEPLFQFKINGKYADAEAELKKTLAGMSEESQRYFRNCNYLIEVSE